jgi:hypothetical protein
MENISKNENDGAKREKTTETTSAPARQVIGFAAKDPDNPYSWSKVSGATFSDFYPPSHSSVG